MLDLNNEMVWKSKNNSIHSIDLCHELMNIRDIYENSEKGNMLILLPKDMEFNYAFNGYEYCEQYPLRNMLITIDTFIFNYLGFRINLGFENNYTKIGENLIKSSFYFKNVDGDSIVTTSEDSNKPTTIKVDSCYLTTLNPIDIEELKSIIDEHILIKEENIPDWLKEYNFNNDETLKKEKSQKETELDSIKKDIENINDQICNNIYFKRILTETGQNLVQIVFKILDDFSANLETTFVDLKDEDLLFDFQGYTFLGEIKGVSSNVKMRNVSQLDDHYVKYIEDKTDEEIKNIKALLIINHQRQMKIDERQPVAERVVEKAKRNDSLIIESQTLLKIYEQYKKGEVAAEDIKEMFMQSGLLII